MQKSAIILAGGNATRFKNIDKSFLKKDNRFFIEIILDKIKIFDEIIIVTNNFESYKYLVQENNLKKESQENFENNFEDKKIILTEDIVKGIGPMGGIYSGLMKTSCQESLVMSCDIPNISDTLIKFLYELQGEYFSAIPFHSENKAEPLCGLYKKSLVTKIKSCIENKSYKLENIFMDKNSELINIDENNFKDYEKIISSFYNVNTQEDFENLK
ncbi:MAG: molybdenum cofactor guanylyltransferase [Fusobacteriaceae bacterium]